MTPKSNRLKKGTAIENGFVSLQTVSIINCYFQHVFAQLDAMNTPE